MLDVAALVVLLVELRVRAFEVGGGGADDLKNETHSLIKLYLEKHDAGDILANMKRGPNKTSKLLVGISSINTAWVL